MPGHPVGDMFRRGDFAETVLKFPLCHYHKGVSLNRLINRRGAEGDLFLGKLIIYYRIK
jgi:GH24 family phage-related lysozyme (muramidase)